MKFGQKLQEFVYFLTTNDKYSEFDSRKSFNRINKPDSENLLGHHHNNSSLELVSNINDENSLAKNGSNSSSNNLQGIHEVNLAWRHIKNWLHKYSPDLNNSLQSKCTDSDLQDFQKDLSIKLPNCVIQYFKLVDGQYSDFESSGLIFGLKLMSLDEITTATENWRRVAGHLNEELKQNFKSGLSKLPSSHSNSNQLTRKFTPTSSSADSSITSPGANDIDIANIAQEPISTRSSIDISTTTSRTSSTHSTNTATSMTYSNNGSSATLLTLKKRGMNIPKQRSIPPNFIRETFAHPMWIPLITDGVGNYVGIDLSPASEGLLGQVILFGRDFDFKFQISDNWGDFLLIFANDLELGNWDLKQEQKNNDGDLFVGNEGDLVFIDKSSGLEVPYFEVLKTRSVKKWLNNLQKSSISSSTNTEEEADTNDKHHEQLLDELKNSQVSILTLSNKKFQSIDSFINNNLTLIDSMKKSELEGKSPVFTNHKTKLSSPSLPVTFTNNASKIKSPLSQDVTETILEGGEEEEEATKKKSTQPQPPPPPTTTTTTKTNIDQTLEEVDL